MPTILSRPFYKVPSSAKEEEDEVGGEWTDCVTDLGGRSFTETQTTELARCLAAYWPYDHTPAIGLMMMMVLIPSFKNQVRLQFQLKTGLAQKPPKTVAEDLST